SAEAKLAPKLLLQWIAAYSGLSAAWFLGDTNIHQTETALTVARIALADLRT
ncbi:3'-kinase, partial [Rhizobium leguminosarum]